MIEPVVFAAAESALADHLAARLAERDVEVAVLNELPATSTAGRYVLIARIGGGLSNLITDTVRVVIECVDEYGSAAAELAGLVRALVDAAAPGYLGAVWVDQIRDLGMSYSPDPDTNAPRYLIHKELLIKGGALT